MSMTETPRKEFHPKEHTGEKPQLNIQDVFLNNLRRDRVLVTIFLVGGIKLTGKIKSFDKYAVLLENNTQEQLIFKHAISTVTLAKSATAPPTAPPMEG